MIIVLLIYILLSFFILKVFRRKTNLTWKAMVLVLPFFIITIKVLEYAEGKGIHYEESYLYSGFLGLMTFFVPHVLFLLGIIGWIINIKKRKGRHAENKG